MRLRFAPSPTGHLHVGNARTALFNWLLARGAGGTFILRIEDTDVERSSRASESAIHDDLRWLGLTWDEGPDAGGPYGPYRQSERLSLYREHAARLLAQGAAYYCFVPRSSSRPHACERLRRAGSRNTPARAARWIPPLPARGSPPASRRWSDSRCPTPARSPSWSRTRERCLRRCHHRRSVLVRSDGHPAYNFAVVIDDALMRVTHVIRGEDHISNTPRQLLLYRAFGYAPPTFAHLSLVLGPDHSPLSKRHGATSVKEFRDKGYLPEALFNYLALIGWSPGQDAELLPAAELARRFRLEDVGHSAGVFDEEKLAWVNRHYLKAADPARLASLAAPFLRSAGYLLDDAHAVEPVTSAATAASSAVTADDNGRAYLESLVPLFATSVDRLQQVPERLRVIFAFEPAGAVANPSIASELEAPGARAVVAALAEDLAVAPRCTDRELFRAAAQRVRERTGQKGRALFHPIRVALTARRTVRSWTWWCRRSTAAPSSRRQPALPRSSAAASARPSSPLPWPSEVG